jgi:hypothetical protein
MGITVSVSTAPVLEHVYVQVHGSPDIVKLEYKDYTIPDDGVDSEEMLAGFKRNEAGEIIYTGPYELTKV